MITYLIDGFNLVHKIPAVKKSSFPRRDLIQFIKKKGLTGSRNNKVIIVYDGHDNDEVGLEKEFTVLFSKDRTADAVIKDKLQRAKNKSQIIVVSDDREVRDAAGIEGAKSCRIHEFLRRKPAKEVSDDKYISCSEAIEINEELEKIWKVN